MDVTADEVDGIPRGNLRVLRSEFAAVWSEAERLSAENSRTGTGDWYVTGVLVTCRWLAGAVVTSKITRRHEPAWAPVSHRSARAHEELIEAETLAAMRQVVRHPGGIEEQPGWLEAVVATLNWAWRGSGVPPLEVRRADAG